LFRGKLRVQNKVFKVAGFQPDLVSFSEGSEGVPSSRSHDLSGEFMGSKGFISSSGEGSEMSFNSREGGIGNDRGKGVEFISHHEIEGGLAGYGMRAVIVGKFSMRDHFRP
jgi:hypothetical protein